MTSYRIRVLEWYSGTSAGSFDLPENEEIVHIAFPGRFFGRMVVVTRVRS